MRTRLRWSVFVTLAALAVFGVWWRASRSALLVETAVVTRQVFEETLVADARTRVRWHVDVTAPVSGEWTPSALQVGDRVAAGALLGTLTAASADPANARALAAQLGVADAELAAARAARSAAAAASAEAERALGRAERLTAAGGVTEEELDRARTLVEARQREDDIARARVSAATFARDAIRALLPGGGSTVRVTAPGAGVVLRQDEEHARVVPAGAPLMMLGSSGALEVVVDVLSTDVGRIPTGAPILLFNGADSKAHVLRIEPAAHTVRSALGVDEQRVSVIGDIHAPGALGHDFEVRARIVLGRHDAALVIPSGALVRDGDAWSVFAIDANDRAHLVRVKVLVRGAEQAMIEGIAEGTRVVVHPPEALEEGTRVDHR